MVHCITYTSTAQKRFSGWHLAPHDATITAVYRLITSAGQGWPADTTSQTLGRHLTSQHRAASSPTINNST